MFKQRNLNVSVKITLCPSCYLNPVRVVRWPAGYTLKSPFLRRIEQLLVYEDANVHPVSDWKHVRDGVLVNLAEVDGLRRYIVS